MGNTEKLNELLTEYGVSHQHPVNIMIHKICVPAILFSVIGLVYSIPLSVAGIHLVHLVLGLALLYYLRLSLLYTIISSGIFVAFTFLAGFFKTKGVLLETSIIVFVTAWLGQFYGHKVEGKKPSFFQDLQFLLIGPLWTIKTILKLKY